MSSPTGHPGVTSRRANAGKRASRNKTANEKAPSAEPLALSVPEAGRRYFGLDRNASYAAATSGQIPCIRIGKLNKQITIDLQGETYDLEIQFHEKLDELDELED